MPKRAEILRKIQTAADTRGVRFTQRREGANHSLYDLDGLMVTIGRHKEFTNRHAEMVYKQCQSKLGKDWWK